MAMNEALRRARAVERALSPKLAIHAILQDVPRDLWGVLVGTRQTPCDRWYTTMANHRYTLNPDLVTCKICRSRNRRGVRPK